MINARSYEEAAGLRRENPQEPFPKVPSRDCVQAAGSAQRKDERNGPLIRPDGSIERDLTEALEKFDKPKMVTFDKSCSVPWDLLKDLNRDYLLREHWVPLERTNGTVRVLIDHPGNILKKDTIQNILKAKSIEYCPSPREDIALFIHHFFQSVESLLEPRNEFPGVHAPQDEPDREEGWDVSESDSVVMQLVNKIINDACARRASDIHIEPMRERKGLEVRYRVDGSCIAYQTLPYAYRAALVSRIKIMANLDITERRLPQDGKIKFRRAKDDEIELRVATLPTQGGNEDVVLRILPKGDIMSLDEMAMSRRNHENFLHILEKPYGLILVVGPTGSGKTTTLHAALHRINRPETKIWTIEDPVEITQDGIRQVQVNPKIGLDFARAMRSFLRADPDVIMVGEMRDFETAKIGIEASLTGHLVLSTLHTNSAPETIVRLLDMGIDPLNFADSLLGILAQRLAKKLCTSCREPYRPCADELDRIALICGEQETARMRSPLNGDSRLYRPRGCPECSGTGYRGRIAVHELLVATDDIKRAVQKGPCADLIRETAVSGGMTTLLQDGVMKVIQGITDLHQIRKVCIR